MQDIQKYPTVTSLQLHQADPSLEKDKKSIYNHPLYPLLSLLLEQCEQATTSPESTSCTSDTFESDLQAYIQRNENNDKFFLTDNKDLDSLMVKAIQVLRIHLIELRKVNELCKDFCSRYINCLKTKIHSDSLFDDSEESSQNGSERMSPNILQGGGSGSAYNSPYSSHAGSISRGAGGFMDLSGNNNHNRSNSHIIGSNGGDVRNGSDCIDYINGSANSPMSELTMGEDINNNTQTSYSHHHHHHHHHSQHHHYNSILDPSKQKRGVLPKKATQIMKQWLFQHLVHPYPTEDEKRQIAGQTNLTLLQVNNWFINARRRILQPMLDSSNSPLGFPSSKDKNSSQTTTNSNGKFDKSDPGDNDDLANSSSIIYSSSCGNRKKKAATNRPSNNRFWPASLAAAVSMLSPQPTINMTSVTSSASSVLASPVAVNALSSNPLNAVSNSLASHVKITSLNLDRAACNPNTNVSSPRKRSNDSITDNNNLYQPPKLFNGDGSVSPVITHKTSHSVCNTTTSTSTSTTSAATAISGINFSHHYHLPSDLDLKSITNSIISNLDDKRHFIELESNRIINNNIGYIKEEERNSDFSSKKDKSDKSSQRLLDSPPTHPLLLGNHSQHMSAIFAQHPYSYASPTNNNPSVTSSVSSATSSVTSSSQISLAHQHTHPLAHSLYNAASHFRYHQYESAHPSLYTNTNHNQLSLHHQHPQQHQQQLSDLFQFPSPNYPTEHLFAATRNPTNPNWTEVDYYQAANSNLLLPQHPHHHHNPNHHFADINPLVHSHHHSTNFSDFALKAAAFSQHTHLHSQHHAKSSSTNDI